MPQADFLETRLEDIVTATLELADVEGFEDALRDIVPQLRGCVEGACLVNTSDLLQRGADSLTVSKLLRALQAICIEEARKACPPGEFPEFVVSLRRCIRKTLPSSSEDKDRLQKFQCFLETGTTMGVEGAPMLPMFQCIMETLRDLVFVHDSVGTLLYLNPFGMEMLRCSAEDLKEGLNIFDFIVPEYRDVVAAQLEAPGGMLRAPYTIEICTMDGERIPVEISWRAMTQENPDNHPIVGVARDLRLGRRLHEEIRKAHAYLDSLTQNAPIGILLTDENLVIQDANPMAAALCGVPDAKSLVGMPAYKVGGDETLLDEPAFRRVLSGVGTLHERVRLRSCLGGTMTCDVFVSAVMEHGEAQGVLVLLVDVSQETAFREHLVQSEKLSALGDTVGGIAHELNNPLTGILGLAELLAHEENRSVRTKAQRIVEEATRCKQIISTLMAFARQCRLEKTKQDINNILRDTLALYEYQLNVDQIHVVYDLQKDLPLIEVAVREMMRVVLNLVNNAHRALTAVNDRDRILKVSSRFTEGKVLLQFEDNGCGIPKRLLPRVFDPFFTTREVGHGAGLGLTLAYGIVESHGGTISIDSEEGRGTTVTICLPVEQ